MRGEGFTPIGGEGGSVVRHLAILSSAGATRRTRCVGGERYSRRMSENSDSDDERWLIVKGRRWRRIDPALEPSVIEELKSRLGAARNAVKQAKRRGAENDLAEARRRVDVAKHGLGERGEYWWEMSLEDRRRRAETALNELR